MKNFLPRNFKQTGFTLIELLLALTIITILSVVVYAALNPAQRLSDSKSELLSKSQKENYKCPRCKS